MLADFHPKGDVARAYGLYHEDKGITDRATVIIDTEGKVRYAHSVGIPGKREATDLLAECRKLS
jgi:alkyl hydroperoxide reductase subunit AhpC